MPDLREPALRAHLCTGKAVFESPVLAREVAQRSRKRNCNNAQPYKCVHCGKWHIGESQGDKRHGMIRLRVGNGGRDA